MLLGALKHHLYFYITVWILFASGQINLKSSLPTGSCKMLYFWRRFKEFMLSPRISPLYGSEGIIRTVGILRRFC